MGKGGNKRKKGGNKVKKGGIKGKFGRNGNGKGEEKRVEMTETGKFIGLTQRKLTDVNLVEIRVGKLSQSAMVDSRAQISCMSE